VPGGLPRREDFALPSRAALEEALGDLATPWCSGPFGERTRDLLRRNAQSVAERLEAYDALVARVRAGPGPWVVTHGEPHRANLIRDHAGGLHLVDWDTTLFAPRERDLGMVLDGERTGWAEYTAHAGPVDLNEEAVALYRRWWDLAEIGIFVAEFRHRHGDSEDTKVSWEALNDYLP
jgi:spectinomycin phosphotransferase